MEEPRLEMSTNQERCGTCRYFFEVKPSDRSPDREGECRRFPPVRVLDTRTPTDLMAWAQPITLAALWCGEWRSAKSNEEKIESVKLVKFIEDNQGSVRLRNAVCKLASGERWPSVEQREKLTVGDLLKHSIRDLISLPKCGAVTCAELKKILDKHGIKMRDK